MPVSGGNVTIVTRSKASDTTRSDTDVLADDPDLVFSALAGETWAIQYCLRATFGAVGALKVAINAAGASFVQINASMIPNGIVPAFANGSALATGITLAPAAATAGYVSIAVLIVVSTSGPIALQWAQGTSDATATLMKRGSFLTATRL